MLVRCNTKCWDSKRNRRYHPGDQDDIEPLEPVAMYFDFPPGTEVYDKKRGNKTTPAKDTTRIVPGKVEEKDRLKVVETEEAALLKKLAAIQKEKKILVAEIKEPVKIDEPEPVQEQPVEAEQSDLVTCDICGEYKGRPNQVRMHKVSCKKAE